MDIKKIVGPGRIKIKISFSFEMPLFDVEKFCNNIRDEVNSKQDFQIENIIVKPQGLLVKILTNNDSIKFVHQKHIQRDYFLNGVSLVEYGYGVYDVKYIICIDQLLDIFKKILKSTKTDTGENICMKVNEDISFFPPIKIHKKNQLIHLPCDNDPPCNYLIEAETSFF